MLIKEDGYDEWLATEIQKGLDDIKAGRISTLEDANAEWVAIAERFASEEIMFEHEIAYA